MTSFSATANRYADIWLDIQLTIAWQAVVVFLVVAVATWFLGRNAPQVRWWLWYLVPLKMLLIPLWMISPLTTVGTNGRAEASGQSSEPASAQIPLEKLLARLPELDPAEPLGVPPTSDTTETTTLPVPGEPRLTWKAWGLLAWGGVLTWLAIRVAWSRWQWSRALREACPAPEPVRVLVAELARDAGLASVPRIVVWPLARSPFVFGVWSPRLVLPPALTSGMPPDQLRAILLHELMHIRRRDLLWGWVPEIARWIYFYHPVVHFAGWQLRLERELACDQAAMRHAGQSSEQYAGALSAVLCPAAVKNPSREDESV